MRLNFELGQQDQDASLSLPGISYYVEVSQDRGEILRLTARLETPLKQPTHTTKMPPTPAPTPSKNPWLTMVPLIVDVTGPIPSEFDR